MGSLYGVTGRRWDLFLFLDHTGRYERTSRMEPDLERRDVGSWEYDERARVLKLHSDMPSDYDRCSGGWRVLSIEGCEGLKYIAGNTGNYPGKPQPADHSFTGTLQQSRLRNQLANERVQQDGQSKRELGIN